MKSAQKMVDESKVTTDIAQKEPEYTTNDSNIILISSSNIHKHLFQRCMKEKAENERKELSKNVMLEKYLCNIIKEITKDNKIFQKNHQTNICYFIIFDILLILIILFIFIAFYIKSSF